MTAQLPAVIPFSALSVRTESFER